MGFFCSVWATVLFVWIRCLVKGPHVVVNHISSASHITHVALLKQLWRIIGE